MARGWVRLAVQLVGFAVGLNMLGWCVRLALSEPNRAALDRLAGASPASVAALLGLSAASVAFNGLIFWAALRPVRRLPAVDVVATNALATFLANLPFKIGLLTRIAIHRGRDGVPMAVIVGWFGAVTATLGITAAGLLASAGAAAAWGRGPALPIGAAVMALLGLVTVLLAGRLSGPAGHRRLARLLGRVLGRRAWRLARSPTLRQVHMGLDMLASGRWVLVVLVLRGADLAVQGLRWVVAGEMVDLSIEPVDGVLIAGGHFLAGALSPAGMLGFREGAAVGAAGLLGLDAAAMAPAALVLAGAELVVVLAGAGLAVAWLRLDRLLASRRWADKPRQGA
ncbi:MAG: hypothetical protein KatS3mg103_0685 [Phycisphaerales bacterium]|nr:MAG: hypothetical protein KatS3mg103_0685 [Phycisphaerales bacterium]